MADTVDKVTALVTVEPWSDPPWSDPDDGHLSDPDEAPSPDQGGGYLVRALIRHGEIARYVVGPILVMTAEELRHQLIEVCDLLMTMTS